MIHLVDDSKPVRDMLTMILDSLEQPVLAFESAIHYLEYISSELYTKPLAVITDIHMPRMSGYEMMDEVHAVHPDIRFVVISGEPYLSGGQCSKTCMYLLKPFDGERVEQMLSILKRCASDGPVCDDDCSAFGDRAAFCSGPFTCPHSC